MERRTCAAIILFVLGIIEVHSFTSRNYPADPAVLKKLSENGVHQKIPLQTIPLDNESVERIKREDNSYPKNPNQNGKTTRVAALGAIAREIDRREEHIRQIEAAQQATVPQISAIINSYMREGGDRNTAIQRFRVEHPNVANRYIPRDARTRP